MSRVRLLWGEVAIVSILPSSFETQMLSNAWQGSRRRDKDAEKTVAGVTWEGEFTRGLQSSSLIQSPEAKPHHLGIQRPERCE